MIHSVILSTNLYYSFIFKNRFLQYLSHLIWLILIKMLIQWETIQQVNFFMKSQWIINSSGFKIKKEKEKKIFLWQWNIWPYLWVIESVLFKLMFLFKLFCFELICWKLWFIPEQYKWFDCLFIESLNHSFSRFVQKMLTHSETEHHCCFA